MKVAAKLAELAPLTHKFAKQSRVEMFRNEQTQSDVNPLGFVLDLSMRGV
jgi:hypothetical protein